MSKQALINIEIQRDGNQIKKPLPVILFAGHDFFSGYQQSLRNLLPQGIITLNCDNLITSGKPPYTSTIRFKYQEVSTGFDDSLFSYCNETQISTLTNESINNNFIIKSLDYTISPNYTEQYFQPIKVFGTGIFGKKTYDSITPNQYRSDALKFNDNINIPLNMKITGDTGLGI
jgi:hypothetical protein